VSVPSYSKCRYDLAWRGYCGQSFIGDLCEKHDGIKCSSCGAQATRECSYAGQFVCGFPLCANCEGYNDCGEAAGVWGFMNHYHKRKSDPTRAEAREIERKEQERLRVESAALGRDGTP